MREKKEKSLKGFWVAACNTLTFFTFHVSFFFFFMFLLSVVFGYSFPEFLIMYFLVGILMFFIFVIPLRANVCGFYYIKDDGIFL
ncbi:hypothetical protein [Helicobacter sp. 11S03491-1]|uniref:hypothetical protein n=1 Tax=Helicobacter sp. 11S03491-1 TaxID=1476196 RepID=UPI00117A2393|nr:hypothetical protein [Helicobacter sp. 11S03491-1]